MRKIKSVDVSVPLHDESSNTLIKHNILSP